MSKQDHMTDNVPYYNPNNGTFLLYLCKVMMAGKLFNDGCKISKGKKLKPSFRNRSLPEHNFILEIRLSEKITSGKNILGNTRLVIII